MADHITADYVVVRAGMMGMAFADTLIDESDKTIAIVDERANPGGHWTTAYPFVRLHQPASYYGVNSRQLSRGTIDESGWNAGLNTASSGREICDYFENIMKDKLLASGRVQYFPQHTFEDDYEIRSLESGKTYKVSSDSTIVDATYSRTIVPSMRLPPYEVEEGVDVVAPNRLPEKYHSGSYTTFTVVGAGKTGIDACLWLIENNVDPSNITWIMPRDSYYFDRASFQPGKEFTANVAARAEALKNTILEASSFDDFLKRQLACGQLLQLDETVKPTLFHCATVTQREFSALQSLKSRIIRKGRVLSITPSLVHLQSGTYHPTTPKTLYIDCTANPIPKRPAIPVFQDKRITLQPIRICQQAFSGALIAHVEATHTSPSLKNTLTMPVPMPDVPVDYPLVSLQTNVNTVQWYKQPQTMRWVKRSRLNLYRELMPQLPEGREEYEGLVGEMVRVTNEMSVRLEGILRDGPHKEMARELIGRVDEGELARL